MTRRGSISAAVQAAGLALVVSAIAWAAPAHAASAAVVRTKAAAPIVATQAAVKEPETTGSIEKASSLEPNCSQSRRRLWVEGEGWIVRRVTTCY